MSFLGKKRIRYQETAMEELYTLNIIFKHTSLYQILNLHILLKFLKLLKPPSHSDKDHKDRSTFLKRDKRREKGRNAGKNTVFKFALRPY